MNNRRPVCEDVDEQLGGEDGGPQELQELEEERGIGLFSGRGVQAFQRVVDRNTY